MSKTIFIAAAVAAFISQADAQRYTIPSDAGATYETVDARRAPGATRMWLLTTKRTNRAGETSTSTREINCDRGTFRYVAEDGVRLRTQPFTGLVRGSISSYLAPIVCDSDTSNLRRR